MSGNNPSWYPRFLPDVPDWWPTSPKARSAKTQRLLSELAADGLAACDRCEELAKMTWSTYAGLRRIATPATAADVERIRVSALRCIDAYTAACLAMSRTPDLSWLK